MKVCINSVFPECGKLLNDSEFDLNGLMSISLISTSNKANRLINELIKSTYNVDAVTAKKMKFAALAIASRFLGYNIEAGEVNLRQTILSYVEEIYEESDLGDSI